MQYGRTPIWMSIKRVLGKLLESSCPTKQLKKKPPFTGAIKKSHKFTPGTVALHQIWRYQKSTEILCRKLCGQIDQRSHTRLQDRPSFPGNSIVCHSRSHGGMVGKAHGGHELVCHPC